MKKDILMKFHSISLMSRILREFQNANTAPDEECDERMLFTLELISDFSPITEKQLGKIFGLAPSSVSDLVKRLRDAGLVDLSSKARGKPLELTAKGRTTYEGLRKQEAKRYESLFDSFTPEEWDVVYRLLEKIEKKAEKAIQNDVFRRFSEEDLKA